MTDTTTAPTGIRPGWDLFALGIAEKVSERADCVRSRVGAVILRRDHTPGGWGYNGSPAGRPGCLSSGACPRGTSDVPSLSNYDNCISVHAETNAILHSNRNEIKGGTIYVTRKPCFTCRKIIQGAGLARVVFPDEDGVPVVELA